MKLGLDNIAYRVVPEETMPKETSIEDITITPYYSTATQYMYVDHIVAVCKNRVLTHSSCINTHIDEIFDDLKESLYEEIDEIRVYSSYLDEIHRIQKLAEERTGGISDKL